ncbi:hypothetical protein HZA26_03520 [Candidatus Nomurabacteria bacterium]|nr:hypothetical protein [Candidatus Nomurabacteria bacterium]
MKKNIDLFLSLAVAMVFVIIVFSHMGCGKKTDSTSSTSLPTKVSTDMD